MTALCNSCDQPFDANDFCPRCQHYASEQLPEKTLDQLFDENPACRAYRDAIRAGLWGLDVLGEQLTEVLPDPFGDAFGPRCDPFGAQPPAASSCQHRIAIARSAR